MTQVEEMRLVHFKGRLGPMTSAQALDYALEEERNSRFCGPFDFAARHFATKMRHYLEYAALLELEEKKG